MFSCLARISAFFFTGSRIVAARVPGLPKIVAVSPKPADIAFSCNGNAISGFIMLCRMTLPPFPVNKHIQHNRKCLGATVLAVYVAVVHICLQLKVSNLVWVLYQYDCKELFLHIFLWLKVDYRACVLSDWALILGDDAPGILEALKILLVCFKFSLPALEHWHISLPHCVGKLIVSI